MNEILEEDSKEINELSKSQKIYSKTFPSNQSQNENNKSNLINIQYQDHNSISKSPQTSIDNIKKYSKRDSNSIFSINNTAIIQNSTSLMKNIQHLDEDNFKLREALSELNLELKEKENSLNESQKIIRKINEEYTQMVKKFKKLEEERNILYDENEKNKKMYENLSRKDNDYNKILKQNEQLKIELTKTKEIINNMKGNYTNVTNDYNKIEKDNIIKEIIIKDLKIEGSKIINMLQDRELLIHSYSKKIYELNTIIKQKDEQLKLMFNFSKQLNNENKLNVKVLTNQAVKTIKMFYNSKNNYDQRQVNFVEIIKTDDEKNIDKNNISEIIFGKNNNNNDNNSKNIKCSFYLNEAIKNLLYIPDIGINYINKEFLIDNNFKTCLIKTELFSSIIREVELYSFFTNLFSKLNENISNDNNLELSAKSEREGKKKGSFSHFNHFSKSRISQIQSTPKKICRDRHGATIQITYS